MLPNKVIGHRILVLAITYEIIVAHLGMGPGGRLKGHSRKRKHPGLLFLFKGPGSVARLLLERAAVQFFQLLNDSTPGFFQ